MEVSASPFRAHLAGSWSQDRDDDEMRGNTPLSSTAISETHFVRQVKPGRSTTARRGRDRGSRRPARGPPAGAGTGARTTACRSSADRPGSPRRSPASIRSLMISWTARSVMPTRVAMSRIRASGSRARWTSTCPWFDSNVQDGSFTRAVWRTGDVGGAVQRRRPVRSARSGPGRAHRALQPVEAHRRLPWSTDVTIPAAVNRVTTGRTRCSSAVPSLDGSTSAGAGRARVAPPRSSGVRRVD